MDFGSSFSSFEDLAAESQTFDEDESQSWSIINNTQQLTRLDTDSVKYRTCWANDSFELSATSTLSDSSIGFSSPLATAFSSDGLSIISTMRNLNCDRRSSTISPDGNWHERIITPPTTPRKAQSWQPPTPVTCMTNAFADPFFNIEPEADVMQNWFTMFPAESKPSLQGFGTDMNDCSTLAFAPFNTNPPLSRSIFPDPLYSLPHQEPDPYHDVRPNAASWSALVLEPRDVSQDLQSSSPMTKVEASPPVKMEDFSTMRTRLDSSPLPSPSAVVVPSQRCVEDADLDEEALAMTISLHRRASSRSLRRVHHRSSMILTGSKPRKVAEKLPREAIIPKNSFACTIPGCVDKNTNQPKRFRRQEHRKRHEQTVKHDMPNPETPKHFCWVEGCNTMFSRADNLKNHVNSTHGKRNPAQRNRYVASLDQKSAFYDPEWRGKLTEDGYPIRAEIQLRRCSVEDCGKVYFLEDKLKTHMLQHHGKK